MPLDKAEYPDREFCGRQISFSANDCETLFWLVEESSLPEEQKERFKNKLRGYYLSPKTRAIGLKVQKANAKRWKAIMGNYK